MDSEMMTDFLAEARDLLEVTDEKLVSLEKFPADTSLINAVFRGYHTIKGGAGFMELDGLVRLCHALETLFDSVRSGQLVMNREIMDGSLLASNEIRRALALYAQNQEARFEPPAALVSLLEALALGQKPDPQALRAEPSESAVAQQGPEALSPAGWESAYHAFTPLPAAAPPPSLAPETKSEKETQIKVDTARLDTVLTLASEVGLAKNRILNAKARLMARDFSDSALADLERAASDLDRLASNLQSAVMLTRMQPIGRLFAKYPRIVRDLSRTLSKEIEIELEGHETEVDKGMIDDLADPLVHLIRNSADHGIELPAERARAGKKAVGSIRLLAKQEGDRILIEISDDGKGMDPSFIRSKAKEKQIMEPSAIDALTDQQALELIFAPGFSTAATLSSVSGRGVGMDVVKTNINKLGGEITLSSTVGTGTSIEIRIPLTLAVLPALLLKAGGQSLAIPLGIVQEIISLNEHPLQHAGARPVINLRGDIVRVFDLATLMGWETDMGHAPVAAVVDLGNDRKCALAAQGFIGREEVMVKALAGAKPPGVSGVMVDAQGDIVLILDIKQLLAGQWPN